MWIEGLIDNDHLRLMTVSGYEFDWKIEDEPQLECARDKGLDVPEEIDFSKESYVRFYLDRDIEQFISAKDLFSFVTDRDLPLLVGLKNPKLAGLLEERLKERRLANGILHKSERSRL